MMLLASFSLNAFTSTPMKTANILRQSKDAAKYVSEIVCHEVEASVKSINEALDAYVAEHEKEPGVFYSFHEFTVID